MLTQEQIGNVPGTSVYSTDGTKIGRAGTVYIADDTGRPEWTTVHTGLFGMRESFLPLVHAEMNDDRVTVPHGKEQVKDAPNVDPDGGHLSVLEEQRLYDHYGLRFTEQRGDTDEPRASSPERLDITRRGENGRPRLRKQVPAQEPSARYVASDEIGGAGEHVSDVNRAASLTDLEGSPVEDRDRGIR